MDHTTDQAEGRADLPWDQAGLPALVGDPPATDPVGISVVHRTDPGPQPAGISLVRWALAGQVGLWALIALALAVSVVADPAAGAGSWLPLLPALGLAAMLAVAAQRFGPARPWAWWSGVVLQGLALAGYLGIGWVLTAAQSTPAPQVVVVVLTAVLSLMAAGSLAVQCSAGVRRCCLGTR